MFSRENRDENKCIKPHKGDFNRKLYVEIYNFQWNRDIFDTFHS